MTTASTGGNADKLRGLLRWREVYVRLRQRRNRRTSWQLMLVARRHGVILSGDRTTAADRLTTRIRLRQLEQRRQYGAGHDTAR